LLRSNKEFGGIIDVERNKIKHFTVNEGGDYSISYDIGNPNYELTYHSHAYSPRMPYKKKVDVIKRIELLIKRKMIDKALYLFECDILSIHPPSPQDFIECFKNVSFRGKKGSLVFTYEGVYYMKLLAKRTAHFVTLPTVGRKQFELKIRALLDDAYYKNIWGVSKSHAKNMLHSNNPKKIMKLVKQIHSYTKKHSQQKRITKYFRVVRKYFFVKRVSWESSPYHTFMLP